VRASGGLAAELRRAHGEEGTSLGHGMPADEPNGPLTSLTVCGTVF